jgi:GNAT superfamily N-acetyltransferase
MSLVVRALTDSEIASAIDDLARLRIAVFASWPYLYQGDLAYEARYLRDFVAAQDAVLVAAYEGPRIVGVATASPMSAQTGAIRQPLERAGLNTSRLFYFGESVLLESYRGQGIGHAFFDQREAHARRLGAEAAVFAAVVRPATHPARPATYASLEPFWTRRGYAPLPGLTTSMDWKELGDTGEGPHAMQFWMRRLDGDAPAIP